LKGILAEGIVNSNQCLIVDSKDSFRSKSSWTKFLPGVSKSGGKEAAKEEEKKEQSAALDVAWRYNNLLKNK